MAKGENIFKRKDGRWEGRYTKYRDEKGKIVYGYCYGKTYKEAKEKVQKCKAKVLENPSGVMNPEKKPFSVYCKNWLITKQAHLKESTFVKYTAVMERYILPQLGDIIPTELTQKQMDDFTSYLLHERKLAPKSVKDVLIILKTVLKYTSKQLQYHFSMLDIQYPKDNYQEMRILSRDEQVQFTNYLIENMNPCRFGILLSLQSGMRIGEICALKWEDISLADKMITVRHTMQRLRKLDSTTDSRTRIVIDTPKSNTSYRVIPMTETIAKLCSTWNPGNPSAYILTGSVHYMEPRNLQYRLAKDLSKCGLEDVHFHTLRHTFATRCVEVGFEIKTLSEILGHANTTITLDRYVHSSLELKRENIQKLSASGI